MTRPFFCVAVAVAVAGLLAWPSQPAQAAESYDNCTGFIDLRHHLIEHAFRKRSQALQPVPDWRHARTRFQSGQA